MGIKCSSIVKSVSFQNLHSRSLLDSSAGLQTRKLTDKDQCNDRYSCYIFLEHHDITTTLLEQQSGGKKKEKKKYFKRNCLKLKCGSTCTGHTIMLGPNKQQ